MPISYGAEPVKVKWEVEAASARAVKVGTEASGPVLTPKKGGTQSVSGSSKWRL